MGLDRHLLYAILALGSLFSTPDINVNGVLSCKWCPEQNPEVIAIGLSLLHCIIQFFYCIVIILLKYPMYEHIKPFQ